MAFGHGRCRRQQRAGPSPRRRDRYRRSRPDAGRPDGRPGGGRRPERGDVAAGPPPTRCSRVRRACRTRRCSRRAAAFRGRIVRRTDVHLPAALRRGAGPGPRGAGPGRPTGRGRRQRGVRCPDPLDVACGVAPLHASRSAGGGPADGRPGVGPGGGVPGPVHRAALPRLSRPAARRDVGGGRSGGRPGDAHELGRGPGDDRAQKP